MPYYRRYQKANTDESTSQQRFSRYRKSYYRRGFNSRGRYSNYSYKYGARQRAIKQVAAEVRKTMKTTDVKQTRSMISMSDAPLSLKQGHGIDTFQIFPVTWAIPEQRGSNQPADERFRTDDSIKITGVRVRFVVNYTGPIRIRMLLYRPHVAYSFVAASVAGAATHIAGATWQTQWLNSAQADVLPNGPLAVLNLNPGASPPAPAWLFESSDHTAYTADIAKGDLKPYGDFSRSFSSGFSTSSTGQQHANFHEVDWYTRLKEPTEYWVENGKYTKKNGLQVLFYYDSPSVVTSSKVAPLTIATIPCVSVKVYYK